MNNLLDLTDEQIKELILILNNDEDRDFEDIVNEGTYTRKTVDGNDEELVIEYYDKITIDRDTISYTKSPMPFAFEIFSLDIMNTHLKINEYLNA